MDIAGEELALLRRQRQALQRRYRAEKKKEAESRQDVAIELDVLMVYVLAGHEPRVAVEYLRNECLKKNREILNEDLVADVENAYLNTSEHVLASMFEGESKEQRRMHYYALRHVVESALYGYVVHQNCNNGVAPSREQLVAEVLRTLNSLPSGTGTPTAAGGLVGFVQS
jgi:hypothetical protein